MRRTPEDLINSLTGWDEKAIESVTGKNWDVIQADHKVLMLRVLAGIHLWREARQQNDKATFQEFYRKVMGMTQAEITDQFEDEEVELFDDEPTTESGKDDSSTASELPTKPPSA